MRWRLLGLFFFAAAGGVGWTFWVRPEAEIWLKAKLETVLTERFEQDVHLDSLSIHPLLLRVMAEGVRVGPAADPLFTCQRWTFHTATAADSTPFSFFLLTFARSDLDRPFLRVPSIAGHSFRFSDRWWRDLPLHRLNWNKASLKLPMGPDHPFLSITDMEGAVQLSPGGFLLDVQGASSLGKFHLGLRGMESLRRGAHLGVQGEMALTGAPLDSFASLVPARFGRFLGKGDLSATGSINDLDVEKFSFKDLIWDMDARLKQVIWFPPTARPKDMGIPLDGDISVHPGRIEFKNLTLFRALTLSGAVTSGATGTWDIAWKGTRLPLADLMESGVDVLRSLPPKGTVGTEGTMTGTADRPAVAWKAELNDVGYPGFLLPNLTIVGQWKDDWFSLKTTGMTGQLDLAGTLPSLGKNRPTAGGVWTLRAANLDLALLAERNGWPRVRGLLNGSFSVVGDANGADGQPPDAEGLLRIDDFAWGVHQETAPVRGRLTLDREGLRVQGAQNNFDLDVRRSSGVWRVDRLTYAAGGLRLWGRGFLIDADGNVRLEGGVSGLNLVDVPPLAKRFPLVEGRVSTEGRLHGRWGDPVFNGTIRAEDVRWRPGGHLHRGDADLRGGRGGLTVGRFQWDDHLRGDGAWFFGKGGRFSVEINKAPGEELFDFLSTTGSVGGTYSGKITLASGDQPGWTGWARMEGEKGHWGNIDFEETKGVVYFRGPRIELESVEVAQKIGTLRATGAAHLRPLNPAVPGTVWAWQATGEMSHFIVGSVGTSGAWTAQGDSRSREGTGGGAVKGSNVSLSVGTGTIVSLGDVHALYSWTPTLWRVADLTMGRFVQAQGEMRTDGQGLAGHIQINDLPLANLFPGLDSGPDVRFGHVSGTGTLAGSWSDPQGDLMTRFAGAGWKELSVEGDAHSVWKGGWAVPHFSLTFAEPVNLWAGSFDGTISSEGPSDRPGRTLTLDGQMKQGEEPSLTWRSRFSVKGATATVEEALFTTAEGRWRIHPGSTLSSGKKGEWTYHLNNDLRNIHLGPMQLFGGIALDGEIIPEARAVTGRIGAESLWINQRIFDQDIAQFRLSPETLTFSPMPGAASFVQGRVRLRRWPQVFFENLTLWDSGRRILVLAGDLGPTLWDFSLQGWGLQAETLLTLADFDWPIGGPWTVKVRGRGSLKEPEVQAEIMGGPGRIGPLPYDRLEAQAHWVGEWVDVRGLRLYRRKGYLLTGEGRFPVRKGTDVAEVGVSETDMNLHLTEGNLAVLKDVWPVCRSARGSFSGDVRVTPGKTSPQVTGAFRVRDGRMDLQSYATHVRELNGEVTFQNDRARVEHARARVGSGWIEMAGDIGIHGLAPVDYDLSVQSDGPRGVAVEVPQLSVPPGPLLGRFSFFSEKLKGISYGEPRVSLRVKGSHGQHVISGSAVLEGTHFTYPPAKDGFSGIPGPAWWRNFWRLAAWDIQFKTGKETWYRNEYLNVRMDGGLHLVGRSGAWALNGRVGSTEGAINYLGQIFQVKRGDFEVVTDVRPAMGGGGILPYVSGEAERVVTTVDPRGLSTDDTISMVVDRALLGEIQPRFVSRNNPDLTSDRVAMKALGLSSEQQGTPADRDQLFRAGLVQLVGSSAAPLANRLAQKLGIGMISPIYEPPEAQETAPTLAPANPSHGPTSKASPLTDYLRGAGASARIRLTDRVSGVYKVKLDEAKNQTYFRDQIELIVRLKGTVYVRASSELDSQSLLGQPPERRAVLENQWRFGLPKRKNKEVPEPKK